MSLCILESLQQRRTADGYRHDADENMWVFGSLLIGLAAFLALLPFLLTLAGKSVLFVQLTLPEVNSILTNALVRCLFTTDDAHQPEAVDVAVTILNGHLVSVGSCNRHHRTEHRHVHRHRYTNQGFLQTDR